MDVVASAFYEADGEPEALRYFSDILASRCEEPDFVRQVVEHRLADQERVEAIKVALRVWPEHPGAFVAIAHGEVVGRKNRSNCCWKTKEGEIALLQL